MPVSRQGYGLRPMAALDSLNSLIQSALPALTALGGVWLASWLARRSRADAIALETLKWKLRGYEAIATPLEEAYFALMREIDDGVPPNEVSLETVWKLRHPEVPYSHLFSKRFKESLSEFYVLHGMLYVKPGSFRGKQTEDKVNEIMTRIRQAIREDCGTDRITEHVKEILSPAPSLFLKAWRESQTETNPTKKISEGVDQNPDANPHSKRASPP